MKNQILIIKNIYFHSLLLKTTIFIFSVTVKIIARVLCAMGTNGGIILKRLMLLKHKIIIGYKQYLQ